MLSTQKMHRWCGLAWLFITTCPLTGGDRSGSTVDTTITRVGLTKKSTTLRSRSSTSGARTRSLGVFRDCTRLADSVFVDSSIKHIGGCYAQDTSEGAERNAPLFIKDAGSVEQGSSVLFFSYHVDAISPRTSAEPEGRFAWSIWYLTDVEGDRATTNHTTCSSFAVDDVALGHEAVHHPADPRFLGTWTCSEFKHDEYTADVPADFKGTWLRQKSVSRQLTEAQGGSDDDNDDEDSGDDDSGDDDSEDDDSDDGNDDDSDDGSDDDSEEDDSDDDSDDDDDNDNDNDHHKDEDDEDGGGGGGSDIDTAEIFLIVLVVGAVLILTGFLFWQGRRAGAASS